MKRRNKSGRLFAGLLCLLLGLFCLLPCFSAWAAGTAVDWEAYIRDPAYEVYCDYIGFRAGENGFTFQKYRRYGGWSSTDPTLLLRADRNSELAVSQPLTPVVALPQDVISAFDHYRYNEGNDNRVCVSSWLKVYGAYLSKGDDYTLRENKLAYVDVDWDTDVYCSVLVFGYNDPDQTLYIQALESGGSVYPFTDESKEEWEERGGRVADSMRKDGDRLVFLRTTDSGESDNSWTQYNGTRRSDRHQEHYVVLDPLQDVPGFYAAIIITATVNYSYSWYDPCRGSGTITSEASAIDAAYGSVYATLFSEVVPKLVSMPISFTWGEPSFYEPNPKTSSGGQDPSSQEVTTHAETNPGEDAGTEINPGVFNTPKPGKTGGSTGGVDTTAVVLSVGGALAAAGAAGAAAGKKKGKEEEQQIRYKMYIYKDFGDAIQKGMKPVYVYARISQIIDGKEFDCPEQTERIRASGEGLSVRGMGMTNSYYCAQVSAEEQTAAEEGTVTFTLAGPGGEIRRNIIFRLVGEPKIAFPRATEDGGWDLNADESTVEMVAGEGGRERLRFVILDAPEEPESILFHDHDGFDIDCEKDTKLAFTYYALIDNRTDPMEKGNGIFADKEDVTVQIEALFKEGKRARNSFTIELYPDGLSVLPNKDIVKDDWLIVNTVENPDAKPGYARIQPVIFDVLVCYVNEKGKAVIKKNPSIRHEDPDDEGRYGLLFRDNFEYRTHHMGAAGIAFFPETTLPVMSEPYIAFMLLTCSTEREDFEGKLPIRFFGDEPKKPSTAEWGTALEGLKKSVRYFGVDNDPGVKAILRDPESHSAAELENARKHVIAAAVKFYEEEGRAHQQMSDLYTNYLVIAGSLVKAGDYAVEFILVKSVPFGKTASYFVNPLKNMLFTYIGEVIANGKGSEDTSIVKTVLESSQEALWNAVNGDIVKITNVDPGKLGYVISAYVFIGFVKYYYYGEGKVKGDIYKAVVAAVGDLALAKFKTWLSNLLAGAGEKLWKSIGNWCGKMFRNFFSGAIGKTVQAAGDKAFESGIRTAVEKGGVSTADYLAARASKEAAKQLQEESVKQFLNYSAGEFSKEAAKAANVTLGLVLNYVMGGKLEKNEEALGAKTEDVLTEYLCDRLGLKIGEVYTTAGGLFDVSVRVEDWRLKLAVMGYGVDIPLLENAEALCGMLVDFFFAWMEEVFRYTFPGPFSVPDLRDTIENASELIEREAERLKNLPPIEYTGGE